MSHGARPSGTSVPVVLPGRWCSLGNISDVWREAEPPDSSGAVDEARDASVARKDLEGERSPGRRGRLAIGNDRVGVTDSKTEQGHEADARVGWSIEGRIWQRKRFEVPSAIGENGKAATATVTWCGFLRGESFEGCEDRRGEGVGTPDGSQIRLVVGREPGSRETRRTPGLAAGCNKPATSERRKPSRWCETTRTERDFEGGSLGTEARAARLVWEWTLGGTSVEG
jgi:hypothetical protein